MYFSNSCSPPFRPGAAGERHQHGGCSQPGGHLGVQPGGRGSREVYGVHKQPEMQLVCTIKAAAAGAAGGAAWLVALPERRLRLVGCR